MKMNRMNYSAAQRDWYLKNLRLIIKDINKNLLPKLIKSYKKNDENITEVKSPLITKDSIVSDVMKSFNEFKRKTGAIIKNRIDRISNKMVNDIDKSSFSSFKKELKNKYNLETNENIRQHKTIKKALINENVSLITNISDTFQERIVNIVYRSVSRGEDLTTLEKRLNKEIGITERRAKTIARDQTNKITSSLMIHNYKSNGITHAIWVHAGNPKKPRESHVRHNNKVFELEKGAYIDGEYIQPGQKINCGCTAIPIMPSEAEKYVK